jgi:RNA polymerase sigma-70 factor, ECF subfamily
VVEALGTEHALVERLRAGEVEAFAQIVEAWSPSMLRVARGFVSSTATAEDVVQETWLAVIRGIDRFEERSSLRTWTFRILGNRARTRGVRDARVVPESSLRPDDDYRVDPRRFRGADDRWPGHWTDAGTPRQWQPSPEDASIAGEIRIRLASALEELPGRQRLVVTLRDIDGLDSEEVCAMLDISPANQRVLLHRGRARLRAALEDYYFADGNDR